MHFFALQQIIHMRHDDYMYIVDEFCVSPTLHIYVDETIPYIDDCGQLVIV